MFHGLIVLATTTSVAMGAAQVIGSDFQYINYADDGTSYFAKVVAQEGATIVLRMKKVTEQGEQDLWNIAVHCSEGTIEGDPVEPETVGEDWFNYACSN